MQPKIDENILKNSSEEHQIRLKKVEELRAMGIEPWPENKEINSTIEEILKEFTDSNQDKEYIIAGRVVSSRGHGKTLFAHIQDYTGKLQLYFKEDLLGQEKFKFLEKFIDIGDIIWVKGNSFRTKAGEITLRVQDFSLLSKCLFPLPDKFHGLEDIEARYRQRYLDLISNEESQLKFKKRSRIISETRNFLEKNDYIEVETPMLHPIPGGAAARPFVTHHNALDSDFYLRIAPELYLKRLVVGGFEKVFEINRNFRNEGISTRHNPEFTMLEFYTAYKDYKWAMDFVEELMRFVIQETCGNLQLKYGENIIDYSKPFERISIRNSVLKYGNLTEKDLYGKNNQEIYTLFENLVESKLIQPTFVTDFPIEISPLAKRLPVEASAKSGDPETPDIAARFELYIGGMELSNGFNELNDPFDQALRFKQQAVAKEAGDLEAHYYDAEYVHALEYALPPAAGVGIGIDRFVMLLTNTTSIKDVILFPTLKKK